MPISFAGSIWLEIGTFLCGANNLLGEWQLSYKREFMGVNKVMVEESDDMTLFTWL